MILSVVTGLNLFDNIIVVRYAAVKRYCIKCQLKAANVIATVHAAR